MLEKVVEIVLILLLLIFVIYRDACDGHRDSDIMKSLNFVYKFENKMIYRCYLNKFEISLTT